MIKMWQAVAGVSIATAVIGYLAYTRDNKMDVDHQVQRIETKIENKQFDKDIANFANGVDLDVPSDDDIASLKDELNSLKSKQKRHQKRADDIQDGGDKAFSDEELKAQLAGTAK